MLDEIITKQQELRARIFKELKPIVDETTSKFEEEPLWLTYALKLRQLQGVMQEELLSSERSCAATIDEAVKVIGLQSDPFVATLVRNNHT